MNTSAWPPPPAWLMGEKDLEPAWTFGPGGQRFEIEITGDPSVMVSFAGLHSESVAAGLSHNPGVVATANHCVSAIPYVCPPSRGSKHISIFP
jgi:hypothetical protein